MSKTYDVVLELEVLDENLGPVLDRLGKEIVEHVVENEGYKTVRIGSGLTENDDLNAHIRAIVMNLKDKIQELKARSECFRLNIGVFHESVTCTIRFDGAVFAEIYDIIPDFEVEATCYPCSS
jgi:hypothetical protein